LALDFGDEELDRAGAGLASGERGAGGRDDASGVLGEGAGVEGRAPEARGLAAQGGAVEQRRLRAGIEGDVRPPEQIEDVRGVFRALRRPYVAGSDEDGLDGYQRRTAQGHGESGAIVSEEARIGIDHDEAAGGREERRR
jgi:hypothetical protein